LQTELAERFRELTALTVLLREQEKAFGEQQRTIDWLCRVAAALYPQHGWRAIMPAGWRARRARRALQARGLFDSEAYLRLNPDVALMGTDPVIHYLRHGLREGRPRGMTDFQNAGHADNR
jgi:hypothetical protein